MLPDFVILGAQKSATTFVQCCLEEHPQVLMVPREVPCFEDPDYASFEIGELERLLEPASAERAHGIKRADYLAKPEVPQRIHRHLPEARLVAVLRDPVARAISAYFHYLKLGLLPLLPLERGMPMVLDGSLSASYPRAASVLEYGRYHAHLSRYLGLFPRRRLLVLIQEELARDNRAAMRQVYEFLGVDADFAPPSVGRSRNPGVYSMTRLRWLASRNRFMYRYDGAHGRVRRRRLSPVGLLYAGGVTVLDRLVLSRLLGNSKPPCPGPLRRRLIDFYQPEVRGLEEMLQKDLSGWLRDR